MSSLRLITRNIKIFQMRTSRGKADWYKPKFAGGLAQPHEIGRYLRQLMYTDGEKVVAFTLCFTLPFVITALYLNDGWYKRRYDMCEKNIKTCMHYPTATRDED